VFKPAKALISDDKTAVLVTSTEVPEPVAVRYAWRDFPGAGLYNREGLPAVPFRSDDWPHASQ
jgi:sialate O-acetylesterase